MSMEEEMMQDTLQEQPPAEVEEQKELKEKLPWQQSLFKELKEFLVILGIFMIIYVLFFRAVVVEGSSMNNTLVDGDRLLLISNFVYGQPKQGDIVVAAKDSFRDGEPIIKRVIATEGQKVDIDFTSGIVYVDGIALDEPYISTPTINSEGMQFPLVVPEGCVFVMGDNRMGSQDSRSPQIGFIDERQILGKAFFLIIPGSDDEHRFDLRRIGVIG